MNTLIFVLGAIIIAGASCGIVWIFMHRDEDAGGNYDN